VNRASEHCWFALRIAIDSTEISSLEHLLHGVERGALL
jgi:hypothetical protein